VRLREDAVKEPISKHRSASSRRMNVSTASPSGWSRLERRSTMAKTSNGGTLLRVTAAALSGKHPIDGEGCSGALRKATGRSPHNLTRTDLRGWGLR
jgi:hypothetical protein